MQELARETAILPPATSSAGIRHTLAGAVLLALVLRLVVVAFLYPGQLNPRADHWPFGYETGRIARAIASGRGFSDPLFPGTGPTAWMGPVYPYLAAEVFKLCGIFTKASAIVLLSLDSLFSAFTCVPIFFIARRCFGQKTANAAAWGWALFPYAVLLSAGMIWDMCLTTLLLALLLWISLELERTQGGRNSDAENPLDHPRGSALQDGRPRSDHRRHPGWAAGVRQCHQRGGGPHQEDRLTGGGPGRYSAGTRSRGR